MNHKRFSASLLILFSLLPARGETSDQKAVVLHGHSFPRSLNTNEIQWTLQGTGSYRYKGLFLVHTAGLYRGKGLAAKRVLEVDQPRRLVLTYARKVPRTAMIDAANNFLAKNMDAKSLAKLKPRIDRLHAAYKDVKAGDSYALSYQPGKGTSLLFNGNSLLLVEGNEFADAYFRVWLGEKPVSSKLRDNLLGQE